MLKRSRDFYYYYYYYFALCVMKKQKPKERCLNPQDIKKKCDGI